MAAQVRAGLGQESFWVRLHRIAAATAALLLLVACRDANQAPPVARGEAWGRTVGTLTWSFRNVSGARRTIAAIQTSCACTIVEVDIEGRWYILDRLGAVRRATSDDQPGVTTDAAIEPGETAVFCAGVDTAKKTGELTSRLVVHWDEAGVDPLPLQGTLAILEPAVVTPPECVLSRAPGAAPTWDVSFQLVPHPRFRAKPLPTKHSEGLVQYDLRPTADRGGWTVEGQVRLLANPTHGAALELATTDPEVRIRIPLRARWTSRIHARQTLIEATSLGEPDGKTTCA